MAQMTRQQCQDVLEKEDKLKHLEVVEVHDADSAEVADADAPDVDRGSPPVSAWRKLKPGSGEQQMAKADAPPTAANDRKARFAQRKLSGAGAAPANYADAAAPAASDVTLARVRPKVTGDAHADAARESHTFDVLMDRDGVLGMSDGMPSPKKK